jgi:hypothetical protein
MFSCTLLDVFEYPRGAPTPGLRPLFCILAVTQNKPSPPASAPTPPREIFGAIHMTSNRAWRVISNRDKLRLIALLHGRLQIAYIENEHSDQIPGLERRHLLIVHEPARVVRDTRWRNWVTALRRGSALRRRAGTSCAESSRTEEVMSAPLPARDLYGTAPNPQDSFSYSILKTSTKICQQNLDFQAY